MLAASLLHIHITLYSIAYVYKQRQRILENEQTKKKLLDTYSYYYRYYSHGAARTEPEALAAAHSKLAYVCTSAQTV